MLEVDASCVSVLFPLLVRQSGIRTDHGRPGSRRTPGMRSERVLSYDGVEPQVRCSGRNAQVGEAICVAAPFVMEERGRGVLPRTTSKGAPNVGLSCVMCEDGHHMHTSADGGTDQAGRAVHAEQGHITHMQQRSQDMKSAVRSHRGDQRLQQITAR